MSTNTSGAIKADSQFRIKVDVQSKPKADKTTNTNLKDLPSTTMLDVESKAGKLNKGHKGNEGKKVLVNE